MFYLLLLSFFNVSCSSNNNYIGSLNKSNERCVFYSYPDSFFNSSNNNIIGPNVESYHEYMNEKPRILSSPAVGGYESCVHLDDDDTYFKVYKMPTPEDDSWYFDFGSDKSEDKKSRNWLKPYRGNRTLKGHYDPKPLSKHDSYYDPVNMSDDMFFGF